MSRLLSLMLLAGPCLVAACQPTAPGLVEELQGYPFGPTWREQQAAWNAALPPGQRLGSTGAPPVSAPIEVLIGWWTCQPREEAPDEAVQRRLLAAVRERPPLLLSGLLPHLPDTPATHDVVHAACEDPDAAPRVQGLRGYLRRWLRRRSHYYRDDLIQAARRCRGRRDREDLDALLRLDRVAGVRVLRELLQDGEARDAALHAIALGLLLEHLPDDDGERERLRARLRSIAADRQASREAREHALDALARSAWAGRDAWFLGCFEDPTLAASLVGPLAGRVSHLLPRVVALQAHEDPVVRRGATRSLAGVAAAEGGPREARSRALVALLPELARPPWLRESFWRGELFRALAKGELLAPAEHTDALIRIVRATRGWERRHAAEALAQTGDPRAPAVLRAAVEASTDGDDAPIGPWLRVARLDDDEMAAAIVAFARRERVDPQRPERWTPDEVLTTAQAIGQALVRRRTPLSDALAARLSGQAEALRGREPRAARRLLAIVHGSPCRLADRRLLRRVAERVATAEEVLRALQRRDDLCRRVPADVRALRRQGGCPAGVAVVLAADADAMLEVLRGDDDDARRALLACAAAARDRLPLDALAPLLDGPAPLVRAAEHYLESRFDDAAARRLLLSRYAGQARVIGPASYRSILQRWDERLRAELRREDGPDEVFALLTWGKYGHSGHVVVRVEAGQARVYHHDPPVHAPGPSIHRGGIDRPLYRVRDMSAAELAALRGFLRAHQVDGLAPLSQPVLGGAHAEYLHATRDGGRRVVMNNPRTGAAVGTRYDLLVARLSALVWRGDMRDRLAVVDQVEGARVLVEDPARWVAAVAGAGGELRAWVRSDEVEPGWFRVVDDALVDRTRCERRTFADWVAVAAASTEQAPAGLLRRHVPSGEVRPVALPAAARYEARHLAGGWYLVLGWRGPERERRVSSRHLLDAVSGRCEPVDEDLASWLRDAEGALQPTARADELWVVRRDWDRRVTELGRLSLTGRAVVRVRAYPRVELAPSKVWVDEPRGHVYAAIGGRLVRLPLR